MGKSKGGPIGGRMGTLVSPRDFRGGLWCFSSSEGG